MPTNGKSQGFKWDGQRETLQDFKSKLTTEAALAGCSELLEGQLQHPSTMPEIEITAESDVNELGRAAHWDRKRSAYRQQNAKLEACIQKLLDYNAKKVYSNIPETGIDGFNKLITSYEKVDEPKVIYLKQQIEKSLEFTGKRSLQIYFAEITKAKNSLDKVADIIRDDRTSLMWQGNPVPDWQRQKYAESCRFSDLDIRLSVQKQLPTKLASALGNVDNQDCWAIQPIEDYFKAILKECTKPIHGISITKALSQRSPREIYSSANIDRILYFCTLYPLHAWRYTVLLIRGK